MQRLIARINSFETVLRVACEDKKMNSQSECLLSLPDTKRIQKSRWTKRQFARLALLGLGTVLGTAAVVVGAQEPERTVLMRRVVPANFHEPDFDPVRFQSLLENSTKRAVMVKPNSTVSGILKEQFNVSRSWTPSVYEQLQDHVMALNNIQDPARELKAGKALKLPDLPRTAQVYTKPGKHAYSQTKSSIISNWDNKARAFTGSPMMNPNAPGTAATELQIRKVPLSELQKLQLPSANTDLNTLIEDNAWQPMQEAMTLTLAGGPKEAKATTLITQPEKDRLKEFLARPANTQPILFILDDSIPSQSDFFHTAEFVIKASREIRRKFGLQDATHGDSPTLLDLEKTYRQGSDSRGRS